MSKKSKSPQLLTHVLDAVSNLKENRGCSTRKILNHIKTNIRTNAKLYPHPRNLVLLVRRAIDYGIGKGLLREIAGRYKLYANSNAVKGRIDRGRRELCYPRGRGRRRRRSRGRRRRRKSSGRRRRRRRRRYRSAAYNSAANTESTASVTSATSHTTSYDGSNGEETDRGKRRRRRHRSRSRRRRRRRRHSSIDESDHQSKSPPDNTKDTKPEQQKTPNEEVINRPSMSGIGNRRRGRTRSSRSRGELHDHHENMPPPDCGDPTCLCNYKREPRDSSPDNDQRFNQ